MATEQILVNNEEVVTLRELLSPGLRCVIIGLNPAIESVRCGHYYQGRLGRRLWTRLITYNILPPLPQGVEDDTAFTMGFGFADLIRRPTRSSKEFSREEKRLAVANLQKRVDQIGDHPRLLFSFKEAWDYASADLELAGFQTYRMPGPYARRDIVEGAMKNLRLALAPG